MITGNICLQTWVIQKHISYSGYYWEFSLRKGIGTSSFASFENELCDLNCAHKFACKIDAVAHFTSM